MLTNICAHIPTHVEIQAPYTLLMETNVSRRQGTALKNIIKLRKDKKNMVSVHVKGDKGVMGLGGRARVHRGRLKTGEDFAS